MLRASKRYVSKLLLLSVRTRKWAGDKPDSSSVSRSGNPMTNIEKLRSYRLRDGFGRSESSSISRGSDLARNVLTE